MEKQEIKNKLIKLIAKELENYSLIELPENNIDEIINMYFIMCESENLNAEIVDLQNKLLGLKRKDVLEFDKCKKLTKSEDKYFSLKIKSNYTIVFSQNLIESTNIDSLDNYIILNGSIQIKQDIANIVKNKGYVVSYKDPYIVKGFNLPCEKLCKILYTKEMLENREGVGFILYALEKVFKDVEDGSKIVLDLSVFENQKIKQEILNTVKKYIKNKKNKLKIII